MRQLNPLDKHGDAEGLVSSHTDLVGLKGSLVILVKDIADLLERHYPGWLWAVNPDQRGGVINIYSLRLSGKYGWRIKTKNIQGDPERKLAITAGGEILERFGFKRGAYDYQAWAASPKYLGQTAMDISDKPLQERRRYRDEAFTDAVRSGQIQLKVVDRKTATGTHRQIYLRPSDTWER